MKLLGVIKTGKIQNGVSISSVGLCRFVANSQIGSQI